MQRRPFPVVSLLAIVLIVTSVSVWLGAQARPSNPVTAEHMREHFARVHEVEAAVIRGDLESVKAPADWLASHDPSKELDKASASQVATMRDAARRAADARDLLSAANATAAMLAACGDCHRAAGARPAPVVPDVPPVGGTVGHMLQHQHAVDQLADGLIIPSADMWSRGAEELKASPLRASELPRDQKLTREIAAAEDRIHVLADQAAKATEEQARVTTYAQIIATCAQCHGLHGRVWGPGIKPGI
jgi:cytochrome c553